MGAQFNSSYHSIISLENLLEAWREFVVGKKLRKDIQEFELNLMANVLQLYRDLNLKTYRHFDYEAFEISDPKPRNIHKASVRDRLLHHALYRKLLPFFERVFINDSYSCRLKKGTHKALNRFRDFAYKVSKNQTKTVWILRCDIRKFFASIDQSILLKIVGTHISEPNIMWLISQIVGSFHSTRRGIGLPLGNLTSQLLVNVYMNEFDQFVKNELRVKYYIRYADDFVFLFPNKQELESLLGPVSNFLAGSLNLELHSDKVSIRTLGSGVDFLGWVNFPDHRVLRPVTRRRMMAAIDRSGGKTETAQSYLGLLCHGNAKKLAKNIEDKLNEEGEYP